MGLCLFLAKRVCKGLYTVQKSQHHRKRVLLSACVVSWRAEVPHHFRYVLGVLRCNVCQDSTHKPFSKRFTQSTLVQLRDRHKEELRLAVLLAVGGVLELVAGLVTRTVAIIIPRMSWFRLMLLRVCDAAFASW